MAFVSLNPLNYPAVLLHWRILAFLFGSLTGYDQRRFVALEQKVPPPPEDIVPAVPDCPSSESPVLPEESRPLSHGYSRDS